MKKFLLTLRIVFTIIVLNHTRAQAQTPTLWGLTEYGGGNNNGTIIGFNTATSQPILGYTFGSPSSDASGSNGSLVLANNGLLYGTSGGGGTSGVGTIFSFDIYTSTEKVLLSFDAAASGTYPSAPIIQATDSLLYGTTFSGGQFYEGVIFSFNINSGTETVLHDLGNDTDAAYPAGGLFQLNDSLLYGISQSGGNYGFGTIYKYNILKGNETVVFSFGATDSDGLGQGSDGALILATDGLLYGMTKEGGSHGGGTIFSFNPSTGAQTVVHSFGVGNDGSNPPGTLLQATDSLLFGMTYGGGADTLGTIFSYNIYTHKETDVHDFGSGTDGQNPYYGPLFKASNGLLYGMTSGGGINNDGMIFSFDISTNTETNLFSFGHSGFGQIGRGGFIEDDITGINPLAVDRGILSVYPNPSSDYIHASIQLPQPTNLQLRLINMLGQTVWVTNAGTVSSYQGNISVGDLADGVYVLEAVTGYGTETREVVVAR